ncbi:DUF2974 domain-containing protein [Priestia megaterium]|uniref:Lipase family protein n=2 Tax=Priestia megaterium TaxID=1404 RepID=A0A0B6ACR1_PRIM2|nr:Ig-like domain-containing protein [Priestia megaterium]AJI21321.1 lipase family protein [Priestia megaterium NBRC 15308 = ATCC 14581]KFM97489.1 lipase family protein [Priestia megaterium]KGJ75999.1 hypothetical protein BMT_28235 [Priestia megaterium NBRC 15308 = ATCC 14581]MDR4232085.1 DUF2974 domain-containing protein [Priestia megaterium]MED3810594.1 Ig-like domain-containing protein [Priestia megaterium]
MGTMLKNILSLIVLCLAVILMPLSGSAVSQQDNVNYGKTSSDRHLLLSDLVYENLDECKNININYCSRKVIANYKLEINSLKDFKKRDEKIKKLNEFNHLIKPRLDKNVGEWKVIAIQGKNTGGFYGAAFKDPITDDIVIAFRGTQEKLSDISYDALAVFLNYTEISQLKPACKLIEEIVNKNKNSKFYLTGHSLGGFLAQRATVEIQGNPDLVGYPDIIDVGYTANFPEKLNNNFEYAETFNAPGVQLFIQSSELDSAKRESEQKLLKLKEYNFRVIDHVFKEDKIGNFGVQLGQQQFYHYKGSERGWLRAHWLSLFYKERLRSIPLKIWDKEPPGKPKVNPISDQTISITGTTEANSTVTTKVGKKEIGSGIADKYGKFKFKIPKQKLGIKISVRAKDRAGNVSKESVVTVKDTTPPSKPKVNKISDQTMFITGTAEVNANVTAKVGKKEIGSGVADKNEQFKIKIAKQKAGTKISLTAKDQYGNESGRMEITVSKTSSVNITGEKISLKEAEKRGRFTTSFKDTEDNQYKIYVIAIQDIKWIASYDDVWAAVSEGDEIYEGNYQIGIQPKGSTFVYLQETKISNYQYNKTRNMIFTIGSGSKNQPDFLVFSTREASVSEGGPVYYMKGGKLNKAKFMQGNEVSQELNFSVRPKSIGNNNIQLVDYWNGGPIGWEFSTHHFNINNGTFTYVGSKFYLDDNWDEGKQLVEKWKANPSFFVETPESRKDVLGF